MLIGNLDGMTVFARVVEEQSFSGAARKLAMSKSAVSKHVTKLEDSLGIRLLNRTTRRLSLTDAGATFYQHCARVVEEIETAEHALTDLRGTPRGTLRISAPLTFGQRYMPDLVSEFMGLHPGLHVDIHLANHRTLAYTNLPSPNVWEFEGPEGQINVRVNPVMSCNNGDFTSFAAIRGLGIAREPEFIVAEALKKGSLVEILKEYNSLASGGIYAVYPERRHLPTKVRIFIDFLVEKFRGGLCNFHKTMYPVD